MTIDDYLARFEEEPGYLDYATIGPVGRAVLEEQAALAQVLATARFGSLAVLDGQHDRMREAMAALTGFRPDQIVFQPSIGAALFHVAFGLTGGVALARREGRAVRFAVERAASALGVLVPHWLEPEHDRVTPSSLKDRLDPSVVAVVVSLVDPRTGFLADLEGIRQVIGDRLLVVDATQGLGVVDAPYPLADAVVATGRTWLRAGAGTGFLALGDRAIEHLTPVWSGAAAAAPEPIDAPEPDAPVPPPVRGAGAFRVAEPDPIAAGRFAAAAEELARVGVPAVNARIAEMVGRVLELCDEFQLPVVSPRAEPERAGIVAVEPAPDRLTVLAACLHNHGVTATVSEGRVRLSVHATVGDETLGMLRAALVAYQAVH